MNHLNKLVSKEPGKGLPKLKFVKEGVCDACQMSEQSSVSLKAKTTISISRMLELFHLDLFDPSRTMRIRRNYYAITIMDDYSRFTWTLFLPLKNIAFKALHKISKLIQNKKDLKIKYLRSDHDEGEFQNEDFESFCEENDINHNFSAPRTP